MPTLRAKPSNDWNVAELEAYKIEIVQQSFAEFFNKNGPPSLSSALTSFCETSNTLDARDHDTGRLLFNLMLAQYSKDGQESAVDYFMVALLRKLGYTSGRRLFTTHQTLPLLICGTQHPSWIDVCLCDENDIILLLVQKTRQPPIHVNPEPELIGGAIAAYQRNIIRQKELGLPIDDEVTFPGITLSGTSPKFYKIEVTAELNEAVSSGTIPAHPVTVYRHIPQPLDRNHEGMGPLDARAPIIQLYQAFKDFL